jgi:NADH-quinone oxidoreductase subunit E
MGECECLDAVFSGFEGKPEELIPILQKVQEKYGYLPEDAMFEVARFIGVPESNVYAVATFYAQFRFTPIGRTHVVVCRGTACHVRGAPRILQALEEQLGIKEGETSPDLEYSLESVACIGACGLSPCIVTNKKVEAKLTPRKVAKLFPKGNDDD